MNKQQFVMFITDCDIAVSDEYEMKFKFVRNIASSNNEPLYRFSLTIVSKLNNVTSDFCHVNIKDDSAVEVVRQAIDYMLSDEVPSRVREVVNAYLAGFTCAGGVL